MSTENLTGLEVMQAMLAGKIPPPPMSETITMKGTEAEKGRVVFEARADERHLNPMGGVHGGFSATVMDSVTGCVTHTMLEAGCSYATTDLNVKMIRPIPKNQTVYAEGKVINASKSFVISEATMKDASGKILTHATATCMILYPK